ncbi:MAG: hypothetical protein P8N21_00910, partial [Opitutales bacterium]|nr:hypothetical protein [Opitutales bacterium]
MLSAGTRIGPYNVQRWIREGFCGQSYSGEASSGEEKGQLRYLKLFHRELSEKEGFTDYFSQECRAIQQIEGRGVWPMLGSGTLKWKHWISFAWFDGKIVRAPTPRQSEDKEPEEVVLQSLADWLAYDTNRIGPKEFKSIIIDMHCGLNRAHASGVIHGNLKPSNILLKEKEDGDFVAWISEFALAKLCCFQPVGDDIKNSTAFSSQSLQYQDSLNESQAYRPPDTNLMEIPEESWDLVAMGSLAQSIIQKSEKLSDEWLAWRVWAGKAVNRGFFTVAQSMEAIPGIEDLSVYGMVSEKKDGVNSLTSEEVTKQREWEWEREQKVKSSTFRRNMTGLAGSLCLLIFLFSKIYLYLNPSPWVEYSMEGASDRYQLGFGIWSGKAWGILPAVYDDNGEGGQDVAGEWEKVDGSFRLNFRKFKKVDEDDSGKKLWQYIGKGVTRPDDYYAWSDYLFFDRSKRELLFVKRVYE